MNENRNKEINQLNDVEILIARSFKTLKELIETRNVIGLKELGVKTSREALEFNEPRLVEVSVIAYSISKLIEKPYIYSSISWKEFIGKITNDLKLSANCNEENKCDARLTELIEDIENYSEKTGRFVMNVIEKARVKSAMQIYAHGASISQAIELTGADKWELLSYMGSTRIADNYPSKSIKERMQVAIKIFKNNYEK